MYQTQGIKHYVQTCGSNGLKRWSFPSQTCWNSFPSIEFGRPYASLCWLNHNPCRRPHSFNGEIMHALSIGFWTKSVWSPSNDKIDKFFFLGVHRLRVWRTWAVAALLKHASWLNKRRIGKFKCISKQIPDIAMLVDSVLDFSTLDVRSLNFFLSLSCMWICITILCPKNGMVWYGLMVYYQRPIFICGSEKFPRKVAQLEEEESSLLGCCWVNPL